MSHSSPPRTRLVAQLRLPPAHQLAAEHCQHCQETLPVFISDEMAGLVVDDLYPETADHLDICPTCFHEYEELINMAFAIFYDNEDLV